MNWQVLSYVLFKSNKCLECLQGRFWVQLYLDGFQSYTFGFQMSFSCARSIYKYMHNHNDERDLCAMCSAFEFFYTFVCSYLIPNPSEIGTVKTGDFHVPC